MKLPSIFLDSLEGVSGYHREAFEAVHEWASPVTSVRLNPFKPVISSPDRTAAGEALEALYSTLTGNAEKTDPVPWCPHGYYLPDRPSFTLDPLWHGGAYYVQDASSMFLWHILAELTGGMSGLKTLDLCAAPGGKTTLLSGIPAIDLVVANEIIKSRVSILHENVVRWGAPQILVTSHDPVIFARTAGYFDLLVTDVPCSGSGLFRKDPAAVSEWSPDLVNLCSQRQRRILADALPSLKEGGILVYATCSYAREENEDILDFLCSAYEMESLPVSVDPAWGITETRSPEKRAEGYRFFPDKVKGEGFFIAALRQTKNFEDSHLKPSRVQMAPADEVAICRNWLRDEVQTTLFRRNEALVCLPEHLLMEYALLSSVLSFRKSGVRIGSVMKGTLVPDHEWALSTLRTPLAPEIDLTAAEALAYLRKQDLGQLPEHKGWAVVTFAGISLGLVKVLPQRVNNYYPVSWRILK
jgi:16S rRNA C967 or C1407 C5-methylase (RsmB/RsmF family)/NOL1/NOP2/fmu family ribosome biogenesis protein